MLSCGLDVVPFVQLSRDIEVGGESFLTRVFTPAELSYCAGDIAPLAARVAAKESVTKALGTGLRGVAWCEVEVVKEPQGKPQLVLHGRAAAKARELELSRWSLSLSYGNDFALALVVATKGTEGELLRTTTSLGELAGVIEERLIRRKALAGNVDQLEKEET